MSRTNRRNLRYPNYALALSKGSALQLSNGASIPDNGYIRMTFTDHGDSGSAAPNVYLDGYVVGSGWKYGGYVDHQTLIAPAKKGQKLTWDTSGSSYLTVSAMFIPSY